MIHDPARVAARAVSMVQDRAVTAHGGHVVSVAADTICVHGDTFGAAELAARLRAGLTAAGIEVKPVGEAASL